MFSGLFYIVKDRRDPVVNRREPVVKRDWDKGWVQSPRGSPKGVWSAFSRVTGFKWKFDSKGAPPWDTLPCDSPTLVCTGKSHFHGTRQSKQLPKGGTSQGP